ncbi:hypothetical protein BSL78_13524 [Apostichopus japonicus]|uniref:Solute carrier family 40 member n=1 Tax=Stichopus japonicus TaxID=307972 RepID=A0A2G8KNR9_STIJA|nr:hypothetical protein BSL78_13524 [Apostichopus japonicus]
MSNIEAIVDNDELAQEYEKAADEQPVSKEETAEEKTAKLCHLGEIACGHLQSGSTWFEIDGSLRLTAIYGFSLTASVLIFGAVVGRWVDRTSRLRAIQISLFLQNSFVAINAAAMCVLVVKREELPDWVYAILAVAIICLGVCAKLTSIAEKICVQKDWIVVIAGEDKEYMAGLNASVRRIDLLTNILAPIVVGQIMTFASLVAAGVFISAWNVISMFVEYILLYNIYISVPALAEKKKSESGTAQAESLETDPIAPTDQSPKVRWNPVAVVVNWLQTTYDGLKQILRHLLGGVRPGVPLHDRDGLRFRHHRLRLRPRRARIHVGYLPGLRFAGRYLRDGHVHLLEEEDRHREERALLPRYPDYYAVSVHGLRLCPRESVRREVRPHEEHHGECHRVSGHGSRERGISLVGRTVFWRHDFLENR